MPKMKILVVEDDNDLREVLSLLLQSKFRAEVTAVGNKKAALQALDSQETYSCMVCDYSLGDGNGGEVFEYARQKRPSLPFILCSSYHPSHYPIFGEHELFGYVVKPLIYEPLVKLVSQISLAAGANEDFYCALNPEIALKMGATVSDLYVRLAENKYVKLFNRGAAVESGEVERLRAKGIDFLFIARSDADAVLDELKANLREAQDRPGIDSQEALKISAGALRLIAGFAQTLGISKDVQEATEASVQFTLKRVRSESPMVWQLLQRLIEDEGYLSGHSVALSHLSCWIASIMGWASDLTFRKLILASFFHDISLPSDAVARLQTRQDFSARSATLSGPEKNSFFEHPEASAKLLDEIKDLPPDTRLIVAQHHERPDGNGFPGNLKAEKIAPLSCLFIVAHELVLARMNSGPVFDLPEETRLLSKKYQQGVFKNVLLQLERHLTQWRP